MSVTSNDKTGKVAETRRRRVPRAQRERQMIDVAEVVFAERGYAAASMDEIAEQVGVSKPMLYEYFNSKEGLLLACIRQTRTELHEATKRAAEHASTAEDAVRSGLHAYFAFIRERQQAWALLRQEMSLIGTTAADEIEAVRRQQTDLIAGLLAGYFEPQSRLRTEARAEFVVGACERLAIWCERHDEVTPEVATDFAMDILWSGLATRSSAAST